MKIFKSLKLKIKENTVKKAEENINILSKVINKPNEGEIIKLEKIKIPHFTILIKTK